MKSIYCVPVQENFLKKLSEDIVTRFFSPADPLSLARVLVVLPHRRGIVYLRNYLFHHISAERPGPFFPPRIIAVEDMVTEYGVLLESPPRRSLTPPDQAWVLFQAVQGSPAYGRVAGSWDRFFPWGIRLAGLLEEIDRELILPHGVPYPGEVPSDGRALLEGLGEIYTIFDRLLLEKGLTTPAKRLRLLAERIEEISVASESVYLAGFYALTNAEERIFKHLFSRGAMIFWHADPRVLPSLYRRWQDAWGVEVKVVGDNNAASPRLHFYESYDLHAELLQAQEIIPAEIEQPDRCAMVLPDPSALIPALYTLPHGMAVNISLGYPLERTPLAALLEQCMRMQEGRDESGAYYYQDYLTFIRHPYVRRLPTPSGKEGRIVLHLLEERIRHYGKPFVSLMALVDTLTISDDPERERRFLAAEGIEPEEAQVFVYDVNRSLIAPWEDMDSPRAMAAVLKGLIRTIFLPFMEQEFFLRDHPLDNEFIHTLEGQVIPFLESALFAQQPMESRLLFALLREVLHMARTPFEGHPLVGLQIMGLLETRLLSFERVIVIDVNEDVVPAQEEINPLLPEALKRVLGLAGREREEAIVRYHFERLIAAAREVHLIWQSSTMPTSTGLEGKKVRSRFVESLLWQEEKKQGTVLAEAVAHAPLPIVADAFCRDEGMAKRGQDNQQIREFIVAWSSRYGLSATFLNSYLRCPLIFFYRYLLGLKPSRAVPEDIDGAVLGDIVHQSLEEYFSPFRKRTYRAIAENDPEQLLAIFDRRMKESTMYQTLAPEKRFFLEYVARYRLTQYLIHMPEKTFIDALEEEYRIPITLEGDAFTFCGKVDRIDKRGEYCCILDYKTGWLDPFSKGHFEKKIVPFSLPHDVDIEGLRAVKKMIKDLQLPLYILLVALKRQEDIGKVGAAYIDLARGGEELYFIPPSRIVALHDDACMWFSRVFPRLLAYIIRHIIEAPVFYPATDEEICRFCDYESVCRFSFVS
jgi:ATP-dependent helicase/nuclease subunit B